MAKSVFKDEHQYFRHFRAGRFSTVLAFMAHTLLAIIFLTIGARLLFWVNILFSLPIYGLSMYITFRQKVKSTDPILYVAKLEIIVHQMLGVIFIGKDYGFQILFLTLPMISFLSINWKRELIINLLLTAAAYIVAYLPDYSSYHLYILSPNLAELLLISNRLMLYVVLFLFFTYYFSLYENAHNKLMASYNELEMLNLQVVAQKDELISINDDLVFTRNQLFESIRAKDKFFSIIGHDLKNPLQSLVQISEILTYYYDRMSENERQENIAKIKTISMNMSNLLQNILLWAISQNDRVRFNPENNDICPIIEDNMALYAPSADKKGIKLYMDVKKGTEAYFDVNMINTVVRNLISNSIKFTENGGFIRISALKTPDNMIMVSIKDSGVGMTKDIADKLFRIDVNVSTIGTNKEKGTGLGLILCKEFVDKHNGKIWVESESGKGSTFHFTLPVIAQYNDIALIGNTI